MSKPLESVRAIWPECVTAAATYGKRWTKLTGERQAKLGARLADYPERDPYVLVAAIHGYVELRRDDQFDWKRYLTPETIYRRCNFTKYLEAYEERLLQKEAQAKIDQPRIRLTPEEIGKTLQHPLFGEMERNGSDTGGCASG
jgi:hypothetical protein